MGFAAGACLVYQILHLGRTEHEHGQVSDASSSLLQSALLDVLCKSAQWVSFGTSATLRAGVLSLYFR